MEQKSDFKKTFTAVAIMIGTVIGAGFLGIPSVIVKSGFAIGMFYILFVGLMVLFLFLMLGEVSLRTKGEHQLTGYASIYLGSKGKIFMFYALLFEVYSAVLAYLFGVSESLSFLFFGEVKYVLFFGIGLWVFMFFIISHGVREMKKFLDYGSIVFLGLIVIVSLINLPRVDFDNFKPIYFNNFFVPFGVVLFSYLGFTAMPEVERHLKGSERLVKRSLILGLVIAMIVYTVFSFVIVGVYGNDVSEISTFSLGKFVVLLGIVTMGTSYVALSVALKDMFGLDYGESWKKSWLYVTLLPLVLFIFLNFIGFDSFIKILSIGGVISGGSIGILILLMFARARKKGNRKPEYELKIPSIILWIIGLIFVSGVVYELLNILKLV
ncbi:MAG: aromatic amino acid transport family protein [Nanoarchaeota archaeon]|nr:aromatic amino acid transport family protein [Nanoarchaeota archaeon]